MANDKICTSVLGYLSAAKDGERTISVSYTLFEYTFKITEKLTTTETKHIEIFCQNKFLEALKSEGIIDSINYSHIIDTVTDRLPESTKL